MKTRTTLAVGLLAAALGVGGWLLLHPGDDRPSARSEPVPAGDGSTPGLAGRLPVKGSDPSPDDALEALRADASPSDEPLEYPPPPVIFVQADEAQLPTPKPVLRIHIVTPWGDLPYRPLGGSREPGYWAGDQRWWLTRREGEPETTELHSGPIDPDGAGEIDAESLSRWRESGWELQVIAPSCKVVVLPSPPQPLPETLIITMEADQAIVRYQGRVRDDQGRTIADAGVFLIGLGDSPGVRTNEDGTFDLPLPEDDGGAADGERTLLAVAPGFLAAWRPVRAGGGREIQIDLSRDETHARLELSLRAAHGEPARGARAWLYAFGKSWQETIGWERGQRLEPDLASLTRRYLPRVAGGQSADEQGYEIIRDDGPLLEDLIADERGTILVPAILPGSYRLRAVLADSLREAPYDRAWGDFHVREVLDTLIEVAPPPTPTRTTLQLQAGRTVTGRIAVAVNPDWHCEHGEHRHYVYVDDWAWSGLEVRSGVSIVDHRTPLTGRFRFEGVPRTACRLRIFTDPHPAVVIDLPAADVAKADPFDLGTITVLDGRSMRFRLIQDDGSDIPSDWKGSVSITGVPDASPQMSAHPLDDFFPPTRPDAGAAIVVRVDGRDEPVAVLRGPFEFGPDQWVVVKVPRRP